jgi:hypothetical protein
VFRDTAKQVEHASKPFLKLSDATTSSGVEVILFEEAEFVWQTLVCILLALLQTPCLSMSRA